MAQASEPERARVFDRIAELTPLPTACPGLEGHWLHATDAWMALAASLLAGAE